MYSYSVQTFNENVEDMISLLEGFVGVGVAIGPILGVYIEKAVGFQFTFFAFGVLMMPMSVFVACLPASTTSDAEVAQRREEASRGSIKITQSDQS